MCQAARARWSRSMSEMDGPGTPSQGYLRVHCDTFPLPTFTKLCVVVLKHMHGKMFPCMACSLQWWHAQIAEAWQCAVFSSPSWWLRSAIVRECDCFWINSITNSQIQTSSHRLRRRRALLHTESVNYIVSFDMKRDGGISLGICDTWLKKGRAGFHGRSSQLWDFHFQWLAVTNTIFPSWCNSLVYSRGCGDYLLTCQ